MGGHTPVQSTTLSNRNSAIKLQKPLPLVPGSQVDKNGNDNESEESIFVQQQVDAGFKITPAGKRNDNHRCRVLNLPWSGKDPWSGV
jgi:hypothetical protein